MNNKTKEDPLKAMKNEFYYTRLLSDDQFHSLKRNEKKLLMISWGFPADSILSVTGGTRAKQANMYLPPPSVYAKWDDYKKNLSELGIWWKTAISAQQKAIDEYYNMSSCKTLAFQNNLIRMIKDQDKIFEAATKSTESIEVSLPSSTNTTPLSLPILQNDGNVTTRRQHREGGGAGTSRKASYSSMSISGDDNQEEHGNGMILSPSQKRSRARPRLGASPSSAPAQHRLQVDVTFDLSGLNENLPAAAASSTTRTTNTTPLTEDDTTDESVQNTDTPHHHEQGLFSKNNYGDVVPPLATPRSSSVCTTQHIGSSQIMKKVYSVMKSTEKFASSTPALNEVMTLCNDLFLVHVRNVALTKSTGGSRNLNKLDEAKTIVTVVSRSQGHFTKMLKATIKAVRNCEFKDEKFHDYECNYICAMDDKDGTSIAAYMEKNNKERATSEQTNE